MRRHPCFRMRPRVRTACPTRRLWLIWRLCRRDRPSAPPATDTGSGDIVGGAACSTAALAAATVPERICRTGHSLAHRSGSRWRRTRRGQGVRRAITTSAGVPLRRATRAKGPRTKLASAWGSCPCLERFHRLLGARSEVRWRRDDTRCAGRVLRRSVQSPGAADQTQPLLALPTSTRQPPCPHDAFLRVADPVRSRRVGWRMSQPSDRGWHPKSQRGGPDAGPRGGPFRPAAFHVKRRSRHRCTFHVEHRAEGARVRFTWNVSAMTRTFQWNVGA